MQLDSFLTCWQTLLRRKLFKSLSVCVILLGLVWCVACFPTFPGDGSLEPEQRLKMGTEQALLAELANLELSLSLWGTSIVRGSCNFSSWIKGICSWRFPRCPPLCSPWNLCCSYRCLAPGYWACCSKLCSVSIRPMVSWWISQIRQISPPTFIRLFITLPQSVYFDGQFLTNRMYKCWSIIVCVQ